MQHDRGFGLYVHWPFCQSKCPYCDFNSHVAEQVDQRRWQAALTSEIERCGNLTEDKILSTIFFGGGTPSLMDPDLVAAVINKAQQTWRMSNDAEITMEANPGSVEADRFAAYQQAGVNRVSIGVQALDDDSLRMLGRKHSAIEARKAIEIGQAVFSRVSFDLIYARQGQSLQQWEQELQTALSLGTSHLSLYQLTIEEGTVFHERNRRGLLHGLPDEDLGADMYHATQVICQSGGLPAYEVSNHARPGQESRHNLIYWRGGEYVGVGPGAHGRLTTAGQRVATEAIRLPQDWLNSVETRGHGELPAQALTADDIRSETLMMGLRIREGLPIAQVHQILTADAWGKLEHLVSLGLMEYRADRIAATEAGTLVLNSVLRDLLAP